MPKIYDLQELGQTYALEVKFDALNAYQQEVMPQIARVC